MDTDQSPPSPAPPPAPAPAPPPAAAAVVQGRSEREIELEAELDRERKAHATTAEEKKLRETRIAELEDERRRLLEPKPPAKPAKKKSWLTGTLFEPLVEDD